MAQRGFLWPDVQAIVDWPSGMRDGGMDDYGRAKWLLNGRTSGGLELEIVCALDRNEAGELTVFITIYWN